MSTQAVSEAPQITTKRSPWLMLTVLCLGFFIILLDTTIVNIAVPELTVCILDRDRHTDLHAGARQAVRSATSAAGFGRAGSARSTAAERTRRGSWCTGCTVTECVTRP